ncbi:MAG: glycosyltransferase [Candidatus Aenigmarchaeota archaeon]|nr:glycosyltransferase [Candidatus Aenigmarchaeota archaeon]
MSSLISIVIPSLNHGYFLEEAIKSVFDQEGVNLRIALVDGGSTDKTQGILFRYERKFNYLRSRPDKGQAAAINEGISRLENATYVGWLNADDLLLRDGLRTMAHFLDDHSKCVAVFARAYIIDEKGETIGEYPTLPFNKKRFAVSCTICQPASLVRRSAWDAVGGLDESMQTCLDYDLWWRLSRIGQIGYLEQFAACTRDHSGSKTRMQRKIVHDEAISILLRHWGMVPRNWCMANIMEGFDNAGAKTKFGRVLRAIKRYVEINKWRALLPQNWLF